MKVTYHRLVQRDVNCARRYYDEEASEKAGDEFFDELMFYVNRALDRPTRYHPVSPRLRRVNLKRFPYNFLYQIQADGIFVTVVRHNRRHPSFGIGRI